MTRAGSLALDTVIFGGGAAGLWLLDELTRRGHDALLLEAGDLGSGQTIASQGIIHGGLKYTLSGLFTSAAQSIRDMPGIWRRCLAGETTPNLTNTRVRAEYCHIWRTSTLSSKLAMFGARAQLRIAPVVLDNDARPQALAACPGLVARLDEQVIDPASFLSDLSTQHQQRIVRIDAESGLEFSISNDGVVELVRLINPSSGEPLDLAPQRIVLLAGSGNEALRRLAGLPANAMQRRPLHMVMVRGNLPVLNGHCVDGAATRLTITTARDSADRVVWLIGGQLAEEGMKLDQQHLIDRAIDEVRTVVPGVDMKGAQWSTYCVDRAEAAAGGRRPDEPGVLSEGNIITGWPTKLALVPLLSERLAGMVSDPSGAGAHEETIAAIAQWPRPLVATPPWEIHQWFPGS